MKNRLGLLALLFVLLVGAVLPAADGATTAEAPAADKPAAKADPVWLTDFAKAKETAKAEKKIILANFTGSDWCTWCIKLDGEVFSQEAFKIWAGKHVVLLKVDFPRKAAQDEAVKKANRALAEQYGIEGFPTVLFLDAEGQKLGQSGYLKGGAAAWIKSAGELVAALKETSALPADKSGTASPAMASAIQVPETGAGAATAITATVGCSAANAACSAEKASACTAEKAAACTPEQVAACSAKTATIGEGQCSATAKAQCSATAKAPQTPQAQGAETTAVVTAIANTPVSAEPAVGGCCGTGK